MDEEVLRAVIGSDEAEALLVAEPLHGSSRHVIAPLRICAANAEDARQQRRRARARFARRYCLADYPATVAARRRSRGFAASMCGHPPFGAVEFLSNRRGWPLRTRRENGCPPSCWSLGPVERWYGACRSQDGSDCRQRRRGGRPKAIDQRPGGEAERRRGRRWPSAGLRRRRSRRRRLLPRITTAAAAPETGTHRKQADHGHPDQQRSRVEDGGCPRRCPGGPASCGRSGRRRRRRRGR